ncbi:MAG TPA: PilZ domain-containing protein [Gemmataceae bacterium]|jgi:hypothetical protein|nr:PilZ domain-containing protein [Gemmataceae bacterium]
MFRRTLTWWRRLVDWWSGPADSSQDAGGERRVWVRYRSHVEATFQPEAEDATPVLARVVNVSRGGMNLLVDRRFRRGMLLSIDLPGPDDGSTSAVLASVLHVTALGPGEWALGCHFAAELTDEQLRTFGARRVRAPASDRRTWVRFPCAGKVWYHCLTDPRKRRRPARLLNISRTGVALLTGRSIDVGSLLSVRLPGARRRRAYNILACVVQRTGAAGEWIAGCSFIRELSEEELPSSAEAPNEQVTLPAGP